MALEVFSGKVTPEVKEQFQAAQQNSEAMTFNAFMELLLEAYLNPKTKPVEVARPTADQLQEIQLKDNEIGQWKSGYSMIEAANKESQAEILRLTNVISELETRNPQPATLTLESGQALITIPPIMSAVLDVEKEVAKKKSGKEFSIGDLLLNNFWESIVNGASHPFRIWSRAELTKLAKDIKEVQQV